MPSKKGQVTASPSMKSLLQTAKVALLALKAPPELDEGGRVEPHLEDWARKDGGVDQCNNKVRPSTIGEGQGNNMRARDIA
jgi:hypothetical protein